MLEAIAPRPVRLSPNGALARVLLGGRRADHHFWMRQRWSRWSLIGRDVRDGSGVRIGRVVDTFPWDGGGEIEMVVVRLEGSLGGRRMLTLQDMSDLGLWLRTPFARWQVEDAPELSGGRHAIEDPDRARSYWLFEEPAPLLGAG